MSLINEALTFSNISATPTAFLLRGGLYAVTVIGTGFGTVTLQRLSADGTTYVTCLTAFAAAGFATVSLPAGTYQLAIATTTAVYADVTAITSGA